MTVLVAVVGVTGTAYAGNHDSGDKKHGNDNSNGGRVHSDNNGNGNGHADFGDHSSHKKHKGQRGAAYGVAVVNVSRGHTGNPATQNPATIWARYSTLLGSPVGDYDGWHLPLHVQDHRCPMPGLDRCDGHLGKTVTGASVYPRILIYRQDDNAGGPEYYCEYGDASSGHSRHACHPESAVLGRFAGVDRRPTRRCPSTSAASATVGDPPDVTDAAGAPGGRSVLTVAAGYYDVQSTLRLHSPRFDAPAAPAPHQGRAPLPFKRSTRPRRLPIKSTCRSLTGISGNSIARPR